jgi:hypothetical protein
MKPIRFDAEMTREGYVMVRLEAVCRRESSADLVQLEELQAAIANGAEIEIRARRGMRPERPREVQMIVDGVRLMPVESIDVRFGFDPGMFRVPARKPPEPPAPPPPDVWPDPSK